VLSAGEAENRRGEESDAEFCTTFFWESPFEDGVGIVLQLAAVASDHRFAGSTYEMLLRGAAR
jgi:hypothetical protein